jgi:hypothetical protein
MMVVKESYKQVCKYEVTFHKYMRRILFYRFLYDHKKSAYILVHIDIFYTLPEGNRDQANGFLFEKAGMIK